jgi:hypothetical protein
MQRSATRQCQSTRVPRSRTGPREARQDRERCARQRPRPRPDPRRGLPGPLPPSTPSLALMGGEQRPSEWPERRRAGAWRRQAEAGRARRKPQRKQGQQRPAGELERAREGEGTRASGVCEFEVHSSWPKQRRRVARLATRAEAAAARTPSPARVQRSLRHSGRGVRPDLRSATKPPNQEEASRPSRAHPGRDAHKWSILAWAGPRSRVPKASLPPTPRECREGVLYFSQHRPDPNQLCGAAFCSSTSFTRMSSRMKVCSVIRLLRCP